MMELLDESLQVACDIWNGKHPVGTLVRYWRGVKAGPPSGTGKTRTEASIMGRHTVVVWIEGCSGCVALTHVEVIG